MRSDMTVKDLITRLQALPQDFKVVVAKNSNGDGFSPLCNIELQQYKPPMKGIRQGPYGTIEYGPANAVVLWPAV
jgi:hypothetical protein